MRGLDGVWRARFFVAASSGILVFATATLAEESLQSMKAQRGHTHGEAPPELLRYLSLKLKPGWRFDRGTGEFVSAEGHRVPVRDQLPKGSKIVPAVPALAEASPAKLSDAERDLARYFQLILPRGAAPEEYLRVVNCWDAVEEATLPPQVSLP
jgi:hypothetical protein